jgi:hypothetical protein
VRAVTGTPVRDAVAFGPFDLELMDHGDAHAGHVVLAQAIADPETRGATLLGNQAVLDGRDSLTDLGRLLSRRAVDEQQAPEQWPKRNKERARDSTWPALDPQV